VFAAKLLRLIPALVGESVGRIGLTTLHSISRRALAGQGRQAEELARHWDWIVDIVKMNMTYTNAGGSASVAVAIETVSRTIFCVQLVRCLVTNA